MLVKGGSTTFDKQVAQRKNYVWKNKTGQWFGEREYIGSSDFEKGFKAAYERKGNTFRDVGISYRINPHSGEKEMFVAGTGNMLDWVYNVTNAITYGTEKIGGKYLDINYRNLRRYWRWLPEKRWKLYDVHYDRKRQQVGISRMAKKHKVDTMYGHSRGGALVSDANFEGKKIGLDAAMILAKNTDVTNYRRPGLIDWSLGISGKKNIVVDSGHGVHWAYGN